MQDISEILKFQMTKEHCSSLCAFLTITEGDNHESLQQSDKQMATDAELQQLNQLGARNRGCQSVAINS